MKIYIDQILKRLQQFTYYVHSANEHTYWHHVRNFRHFVETTPVLAHSLAQLPQVPYDWNTRWNEVQWELGDAGWAQRWDAIKRFAACSGKREARELLWMISDDIKESFKIFSQEFIIPISDYLIHRLEDSKAMLYLLTRYKFWAEWFEAEKLREIYENSGEKGLDHNLRRWLFESGVDYPFSQPRSPGGQADVVAGLETNDPLVLEIKVWDSEKGYKKNRVRDGLRQVIDYTDRYGKDVGYVVVFNLDSLPLQFRGETEGTEEPARIDKDHTFYFLSVNIAEQETPISERDKGKPVKGNPVRLSELWDNLAG